MKQTAKILLVDDEPGMLRYIKTLLEVDDYKVETATTGEEALKLVENGLEPERHRRGRGRQAAEDRSRAVHVQEERAAHHLRQHRRQSRNAA